MNETERLPILVERCRQTYEEWLAGYLARSPARNEALVAYDAAQTDLGKEWRAIGELLRERSEMQTGDLTLVINLFASDCHSRSVAAGWWTLLPNIPEKLCLIHSEISEALEGYRRDLMDDHLPHRKMIEVELADSMIRIGDLAAALNLDLGGAIEEKLAYNLTRADHQLENRKKPRGKRI